MQSTGVEGHVVDLHRERRDVWSVASYQVVQQNKAIIISMIVHYGNLHTHTHTHYIIMHINASGSARMQNSSLHAK